MVAYAGVTAVRVVIAPLGLLLQFLPSFADRAHAPVWTALFVCATALMTIWWWVDRVRGKSEPTLAQRRPDRVLRPPPARVFFIDIRDDSDPLATSPRST